MNNARQKGNKIPAPSCFEARYSSACRVRYKKVTPRINELTCLPVSKIQAVVRQIRDLVNSDSQATLSSRQAKSLKRRPSRDTEWVERYLVPAPEENDLLSVLLQAIMDLGDGGEDFPVPDIEPVDVEWVCPRGYHGGGRFEQQCESLERDCSPQIMYVHGGGYL